jgi:hypothetical protein
MNVYRIGFACSISCRTPAIFKSTKKTGMKLNAVQGFQEEFQGFWWVEMCLTCPHAMSGDSALQHSLLTNMPLHPICCRRRRKQLQLAALSSSEQAASYAS